MAAPGASQRGPGRPPRNDGYRTDTAGKVTSRSRAAWLLRVARLYGERPDFRNLTKFAKALTASGVEKAGPSTISRIERGLLSPTFEVVRGYEDLLGMRPFAMVSVLDSTLRYRAAQFEARPLLSRYRHDAMAAYRRFDELVGRACSRDLMSGPDWDELTMIITERPDLVVSPRTAWLDLTHRLLTEEILADGVPWMLRFEAVNRVLAHPTVGMDALSTLRATVDDRGVQSLVGTACLFDGSAEQEAAVEVVRHMGQPPDDRVFKGALMACVRKLKYTHFTPPQLEALSKMVVATLKEFDYLDDETLALAVSVMRQLPPESHDLAARKLLQLLSRDENYASVVKENRLLPVVGRRAVAERIANYAVARTPSTPEGYVDEVLPLLVDEMLFDPVFDARLYANFLIYTSPYKSALAEALMTELTHSPWSGSHAWITTIFESLRILGGQNERKKIERFIVSPGMPAAIADVAAYALGHIGGASDDKFWDYAFPYHRSAWEKSSNSISLSILDRLTYAIGISNNKMLLAKVSNDGRMPVRIRSYAGWWLNQGQSAMLSAKL